jgi:hypothetical protein
MRIQKVNYLEKNYLAYDITTDNDNFFIKAGDKYICVHNSPSLFFGVDPLDNKFFISTKSLFNVNPKVAKSIDDVDTLFKSDGLKEKLRAAFQYLSKLHINPDIVYQGDIMFTTDKQSTKIDGIDYITFKPNIITYAVSKSLPMYDNIKSAKFGIVVHTMYKIVKRNDAGFQLNTVPYDFSSIASQSGGDLFIISNVINGIEVENNNEILDRVELLEKDVNRSISILDDLKRRDEKIIIYFTTFINAQLDLPNLGIFGDARDGIKFNGNKYFSELVEWMKAAYDKDMGVNNAGEMKMLKDRMIKVILKNKQSLILVLFVYYNMLAIKNELIAMFDDRSLFSKTFKDVGGKLQPTGNEGVVILSGDRIVKLVNRDEFSAINRKAHRG